MNTQNTHPVDQTDANLDPLSGETGAHPLGTGVGAAGAGAAATVIGGVVGGPVGAVIGAVVGSVVGGLAGKGTAEQINPTFEENRWDEVYNSRSYVEAGTTYDDYEPAYRIGYDGYERYGRSGQSYNEVESSLQRDYEANHNGNLSWEKAKHGVRDAWDKAATSLRR
ncbi:hypothetical protein Syn7502_02544 [Synechococcus sp. PCC 7502]|uniref:hypothetical protein n=1 Tax=Synechococcus sp. PCC 7502 TaxID=1173263 RepID=UPI00029FFCF1|nr:hypothetical protein [Synechococcus sp. PCC 7502]AFY74515.1 hypothetical protein Syn7502_02544 [Synechococcus sp. PCC 7502]